MTVELVTGHAGTGHIDSFDVGGLIAGVAGSGDYVFEEPYGTISCTVQDNNHVQIGKGDLIMNGRHVRIEDPETLTVTSGTQGQERHDLVVMHYSRQSSGIEDAELQVLRGTPGSSGTPGYGTDTILDGATTRDMPLYRLDLDGISLSTSPARLFSTLKPVSDLASDVSSQINTINDHVNDLAQPRDSTSYFTASRGWKISTLKSNKIGPWVLLTCNLKRTETWTCKAWATSEMMRIPDWLGATQDVVIPAASNGPLNQGGNFYVTISKTHIDAHPAMDMSLPTGRWVSFSTCWLAEK